LVLRRLSALHEDVTRPTQAAHCRPVPCHASGPRHLAARSRRPARTTVGGLIKHLRWAEYGWFEQLLQERSDDNRRTHERSWEFEFLPEESLPTLLAEYQSQCDESRQIASRYPLDHLVPHRRFETVSLRWIYVHMIEETARHTGQLDILREQLDGATGFDG